MTLNDIKGIGPGQGEAVARSYFNARDQEKVYIHTIRTLYLPVTSRHNAIMLQSAEIMSVCP